MSGPESGSLDRLASGSSDGRLSISAPSQSGIGSRRPSPVPPDLPPPGLSSVRPWMIAAVAGLLGVAGLLVGLFLRTEPPKDSAPANALAPPASQAPPSPTTPPADTAETAPASSSADALRATPPTPHTPAVPAAAAVVRAHPAMPALAKKSGPSADTGAPAASPPAAAADSCSPPYYFDGRKKLYKPGCI
jgi:hypothetical protein